MGRTAGISRWPSEPRVDAGMKERNEMTIGRTDDPENPFGAPAFEAAHVFGFGSRIPSGPAVMMPRREGRTHDRNRPARQNSHFSSCIRGAVHTCTNAHPRPLSNVCCLTFRRREGWFGSRSSSAGSIACWPIADSGFSLSAWEGALARPFARRGLRGWFIILTSRRAADRAELRAASAPASE